MTSSGLYDRKLRKLKIKWDCARQTLMTFSGEVPKSLHVVSNVIENHGPVFLALFFALFSS